jgi:hypothetical protein
MLLIPKYEAQSFWIWFDAMASAIEKARSPRECLIAAMKVAVEIF